MQLQQRECILSCDVKASSHLYQWILPSLLSNKNCNMTHNYITRPHVHITHHYTARVCLKNTYFLFHGKYYEQAKGVVMVSPHSPIVANLFMEKFESKTIGTVPSRPRLWLMCVDDTFAIHT